MRFHWQRLPLRSPDGDPAPPAAPPAPPAGDPPPSLLAGVVPPAPAAPPAGTPPAGDPPKPADPTVTLVNRLVLKDRPDWLGEQFYDAKTGEVKVQDLAKSQADLRAKIGAGTHKAPKSADDYKYDALDFGEEGEALKGTAARVLAKDDPVLKGMLGSFHKHGLSQDQVSGILADYVRQAHDKLPPVWDQAAEKKQLGANADKILMEAVAFKKTLTDRGFIRDEDGPEFDISFGTAGAIKILLAIREFYGEQPLADRLINAAASSDTADSLRAEMRGLMDRQAKGENVERAYSALQQKYEQLYGKGSARTSAVAA